ncbi:MAG: hypothetical protein COT18_00875, partial [Elusimicrobia bacterium CG08_land_8_20_14_0_20_59_10]
MKKTVFIAAVLLVPCGVCAKSAPRQLARAQEAAARANTIAFKFNARAQETQGNVL